MLVKTLGAAQGDHRQHELSRGDPLVAVPVEQGVDELEHVVVDVAKNGAEGVFALRSCECVSFVRWLRV